MINNIKRGPIANCIALHDFSNEVPDLRQWMEYILAFFNQYGITPIRISNIDPKATKTIAFKNGIKKLEACNYEGIDGLWMGATPPNHGDDTFDSIFSTYLRLKSARSSFVLCFDNNIVTFARDIINKLTEDLAEFFGSRYGYCYQRDFDKGPILYPSGTISGLDYGNPEGELIGQWGNKYCMPDGSYKIGDLRDIYPMNVLCKAHLDRVVLGQRLEDWILQNLNHGTLTKFDNNLWAWWIEQDQIPSVREALKPTGIILCI